MGRGLAQSGSRFPLTRRNHQIIWGEAGHEDRRCERLTKSAIDVVDAPLEEEHLGRLDTDIERPDTSRDKLRAVGSPAASPWQLSGGESRAATSTMATSDWIQTIASVVTAIGVAIAAWQLYHAKQQSQSEFEDSFAEQYRRVARMLPLDALLGRQLKEEELKSHLRAFYEYFDLSNEQAFLAKRGRLRDETWANWREGIEQHMSRPGFRHAWTTLLPDLDGSFDELKALLPPSLRSVNTQQKTSDVGAQGHELGAQT